MRRNRRKDLFLDFTSLLDVTLLLLFFFIMTFHHDVTKAEENAEAAKAEAQQQIEIAHAAEAEAEKSKIRYDNLVQENGELRKKLENDIRTVNQVTSQEANAIVAFNNGNNLKLILQSFGSDAGPATLIVLLDKDEIGRCIVARDTDTEEEIARSITPGKLAGWMTAHGIQKDSVIMCDFIYDSNVGRTSKEHGIILEVIKAIQNEQGYKHFYCSETDIFKR